MGWEFFFHHLVQNGSVSHSASYPMDTRALSLGIKRRGRIPDLSSPASAEVKNVWSYTTPTICLHGVVFSLNKDRDNVTFTLVTYVVR
jgi:hypothetical protein